MTAQIILDELLNRGVRVWAEGTTLKLDAPVGVLTDADKALLAAQKAELLTLLATSPKAKIGTLANPMPVQANHMPLECPWDECDGALSGKDALFQCGGCKTFFRRKDVEDPGVFVGEQNMTRSKMVN